MGKPEPKRELSVRQNMLWNMAGSVTNLACQYLITVLVVRLTSELDSAGLYSLAMSVFGIFSPVAGYGLYSYQATDVREENTLGEYLTLTCGTSLVSILCIALYALFTCRANAWAIVIFFGVYRLVMIVFDSLHAYDQMRHRMDIIGVSLALRGVVSLVVFAAAFSLTNDLLVTFALMTVAILAVSFLYDLPATLRLTEIRLGISRGKAVHLLKGCLPIVISQVAYGAVPSIPRQFLSMVCGDATLGIYASVAAPVAIIQTGATYIYNPLISYFAECFVKGDRGGFVRLLKKTVLGILGIGCVSLVGIFVLAHPVLLLLYGDTVASYSHLMYPLVISSLLLGTQGLFNNLLVAMRAPSLMLISSLASLAAALVLCVPLVTAFTMNGVTYALALSCGTGLLFSGWCIRRRLIAHQGAA